MAGRTKEQVPEEIEQTLDKAVSLSQTLSSPDADVHETARVAAELYFLLDDNFHEPYQSVPPFSAPLDQSQVDQTIGNFWRTARKITEKIESEQTETPKNGDKNNNYASEDTVRELLRALYKKKSVKPRDVESRIDAFEPNTVKDYLSDLETSVRARHVFISRVG